MFQILVRGVSIESRVAMLVEAARTPPSLTPTPNKSGFQSTGGNWKSRERETGWEREWERERETGTGICTKSEETTAPRSLFTNSSRDDSATALTAILFTN